MQKVLTAAQMREVDRLTTERFGIPSIDLMENAAHAVASVITEKLGGSVKGRSILILCGKGNNGGDGAALASILHSRGSYPFVCLFGKVSETSGDARTNFGALATEGHSAHSVCFSDPIELNEISSYEDWKNLKEALDGRIDVIVDALFGTGLTRPLDGWLPDVIAGLNAERAKRKSNEPLTIAVDLPSGLYADSAEMSAVHVAADVTVTFTSPKLANILSPASRANGELIVVEIGSPEELIDEQSSQLFLAERSDATEWLARTEFSSDSYKNKRGHALIVAGSENYSGAAVLCGNSAIRSGVGLVTIAIPRSSMGSIAGRVLPEVMVRPLAETADGAVSEDAIREVEELLDKIDSVAIGAGLSATSGSTEKFVRHFVNNRRSPTILDADALTLLSPFQLNASDSDIPLILTPHEGEFIRMLGTDDKEAIRDRVAVVREFSQKHGVILVLKGERVLIGEPGGKVVVNPTGNSGLGKAGNGDTLLGVLAGFVAQAAAMKIGIFETVVAAVYAAGMAGDIAEKKYGKRVMTASDVRECLTETFEHLTVTDQ